MSIERETIVESPMGQGTAEDPGANPFITTAWIIVAILIGSLVLWSMDQQRSVAADVPGVAISE